MRRLLLVSLAVLLGAAFLAALHAYIALRLVIDTGLREPWRGAALAAIALLGLALVAQPVAERTLRPRLSRLLGWPAALWMGLAFLLLVQLLATDLALWVTGRVASAATAAAPGASGLDAARAAAVAALALVAGAAGLRQALRPPRVARVEIGLARWPRALDGLRIVQISDVHIGSILGSDFAAAVTAQVNALEPDLVAVTGDLVDGGVRQLADEVAPFAGLRARHGVYFVTGNHDHYSGASDWATRVRALGMRVLRNERVSIEARGAVFDLAGVDDHRGDVLGGDGGEDLGAALAGRDPERPVVLLAHDPTTFLRAAERGVDLQLSGHTHGGQIWPFGLLVRLAVPFVAGRYRSGGSELYVSRGTGFWGPPMRLFAPAEVTEITLRSAAAGEEGTP